MSKQRNDGGPAFPFQDAQGPGPGAVVGMTLRDYIAAKAITMATKWEEERQTGPYGERRAPTYAGIATRAYLMADAMLKARAE